MPGLRRHVPEKLKVVLFENSNKGDVAVHSADVAVHSARLDGHERLAGVS